MLPARHSCTVFMHLNRHQLLLFPTCIIPPVMIILATGEAGRLFEPSGELPCPMYDVLAEDRSPES